MLPPCMQAYFFEIFTTKISCVFYIQMDQFSRKLMKIILQDSLRDAADHNIPFRSTSLHDVSLCVAHLATDNHRQEVVDTTSPTTS